MGKTALKANSDVSKLLKEARGLIRGFHTSRRKTSHYLKQDLSRGRTQVKSEVRQMLSEFRHARKDSGPGPGKVRPPGARSGEGDQSAGSRPKTKAPAAALSANLGPKVLGTIDAHPDGITMAGIADSLGVVPVVLSKTMSGLVAGGKVRKEGRGYFPAAV
jgi:hypothetical protein